jgi:hypothetical protein
MSGGRRMIGGLTSMTRLRGTSARPRDGVDPEMSRRVDEEADAHWRRWDVRLPTQLSTDDVRVEWPDPADGLDALPTASIRRGDGWVRVHSARRPLDEARRFVQQELGDRTPDVVCVIGAGLGYLVDVLLERGETKVLVLEPEPALVPWFLARRDWRDAIEARRLLIVPGPSYEQHMSAWRLLTPPPGAVPVLATRAVCYARPEAAAAARATLDKIAHTAFSNAKAGERFQRAMLLNTLRNLPVMAREAPVDALLAAFPYKPAVLAGAGPSLNRNIEELRPYRDRAVLIAVGTALKPLVAAGMSPDFVVAVDPGEYTHLQFAGVEAPETFLVAEPSVAPEVFSGFVGRTFVFRHGDHHPWPWLMAQGYDPGVVRTWGSVITTALHLGVKMGCDPLIFIGTDLAHDEGRSHAEGTALHTWVQSHVALGGDEAAAWSTVRRDADVVMDVGLCGREWPTTKTLVQFRDWLRHESTVLPMRFVNATGAGILMGGRFEVGGLGEELAARPAAPEPKLRGLWRRSPRLHRDAHAKPLDVSWLRLTTSADLAAAVGEPSARRVLVVRAYRRLIECLRLHPLLGTTIGASEVPARSSLREPAGYAVVPWSAEARPLVSRFLDADAACRTGPSGRDNCSASDDGLGLRPSADGLLLPRFGGKAIPTDGEELEVAAGCALATRFVESLRKSVPDDSLRSVGGLLLIGQGWGRSVDEAMERNATIALRRAGNSARRVELSWQDRSASLSSVLTGTVVRLSNGELLSVDSCSEAAAEPLTSSRRPSRRIRVVLELPQPGRPRESRTRASVNPARALRVQPRVLTAEGLASTSVARLDSRRAVVTARHTAKTYTVNEDGDFALWQDWPGPVVGAFPIGDYGGAIAWNNGTERWPALTSPTLYWRPVCGEDATAVPVPFRPNWGLMLESGRMVWACLQGGIGLWSPNDAATHTMANACFIGLTEERTGLRLDAGTFEPDSEWQVYASWCWKEGRDLAQLPLERFGPRGGRARGGEWTATSRPYAGLIEFERAGCWLGVLCSRPLGVAWAGESLVVTTLDAEVLVFKRLAARLRRLSIQHEP